LDFSSFGLHEDVMEGIHSLGFKSPTPIQAQAIPMVLEGRDLIGNAQTGTGKTGAFLLPVLNSIAQNKPQGIHCLILAPTRELVKQIDEQIDGLGYFSGAKSVTIYGGGIGGEIWEKQKTALVEGVDIVVATPGRLMAHMKMGYVDFSQLKMLVLDEADKMLDMGFLPDIEEILRSLPEKRQNLMFSATMPPRIEELAKRMLHDPFQIKIQVSKPAERITQRIFLVNDKSKIPLLTMILKKLDFTSLVIFTSTKAAVGEIVRNLKKAGVQAEGISSDLEQNQREDMVRNFKSGQFNVLVATDVMSRGIDIDGISHVVNFDMPPDPEDYVHRIGRTARGSTATGVGISFVNEQDMGRLMAVEKLIEKQITQLPVPPQYGPFPVYGERKKRMDGRSARPGHTGGKKPGKFRKPAARPTGDR
jgi:superfamily II DNA/RNA helicase